LFKNWDFIINETLDKVILKIQITETYFLMGEMFIIYFFFVFIRIHHIHI